VKKQNTRQAQARRVFYGNLQKPKLPQTFPGTSVIFADAVVPKNIFANYLQIIYQNGVRLWYNISWQ
jgi:hypothetical protein